MLTLVPGRAAAETLGPEIRSEAAPEPQSEAAPEPQSEAAPEPQSEAAPEPQSEAAPEPQSEAAPEPQSEAAPEPQSEAAPEPQSEAAPEPQSEARSETRQDEGTSVGTESEAETLEAVRARFSKGAEHYELGEYSKAIDIFEQLYRETREPRLLFNLGQAYWQRYSVDPKIVHLRSARTMFQNYDKASAADDNYDPREVRGYVTSIDAQIVGIESSRTTSLQPMGPDPRMLASDRQRRINTGMVVSGGVFTALGGSAAIAAGVFAIVRGGTKFSLDQSGGGEAGVSNPFSVEEHEQLRRTYLTSGQVMFGTIVGAAVFLPIGILLMATGNLRNRSLGSASGLAFQPMATGVGVAF